MQNNLTLHEVPLQHHIGQLNNLSIEVGQIDLLCEIPTDISHS
jgi:hypothetical protein